MLIFELFDKPVEITYEQNQPTNVIAAFRVGDIDYMFQAYGSPGDERVFDIAFAGGGNMASQGQEMRLWFSPQLSLFYGRFYKNALLMYSDLK